MHFYSNTKINNKIILNKEEMHHCINVLRKKNGDFIKVVDGFDTSASETSPAEAPAEDLTFDSV